MWLGSNSKILNVMRGAVVAREKIGNAELTILVDRRGRVAEAYFRQGNVFGAGHVDALRFIVDARRGGSGAKLAHTPAFTASKKELDAHGTEHPQIEFFLAPSLLQRKLADSLQVDVDFHSPRSDLPTTAT